MLFYEHHSRSMKVNSTLESLVDEQCVVYSRCVIWTLDCRWGMFIRGYLYYDTKQEPSCIGQVTLESN